LQFRRLLVLLTVGDLRILVFGKNEAKTTNEVTLASINSHNSIPIRDVNQSVSSRFFSTIS